MPDAGSESERLAEECYLNVLVQIYELFQHTQENCYFLAYNSFNSLVSSEILSEISEHSFSV